MSVARIAFGSIASKVRLYHDIKVPGIMLMGDSFLLLFLQATLAARANVVRSISSSAAMNKGTHWIPPFINVCSLRFLILDVIQDLYIKELKGYKPAPAVRGFISRMPKQHAPRCMNPRHCA